MISENTSGKFGNPPTFSLDFVMTALTGARRASKPALKSHITAIFRDNKFLSIISSTKSLHLASIFS